MDSLINMKGLSSELNIFSMLTLISLIPFFLISMTTFTRNLIVFSFLRHALGLQQSPPNMVIVVLSVIVTLYTMQPVLKMAYEDGMLPYQEEKINFREATEKSWQPIRSFLVLQTQEKDIGFLYKLSKKPVPDSVKDVEIQYLVPAFMLSELRLAFKIGFIIFLPFLLIDLVIAAMLTSLGMIMVPPVTISLPLKIMLFVVIDGWELVMQVLVSSVAVG